MIKSRADAKLNQSRCFGALQTYMFYGSDFIRRTTLTNPALEAMSSEMLLAKIGELMDKQHKVLYYGPQSEKEVTEALAMHHKTSAENSAARQAPATAAHGRKQSADGPIRRQAGSTTCNMQTSANSSTSRPTPKSRSTTSISAAA